jgi:hypothetical protein
MKNKMNKKGVMKTLEAIIASIIILAFVAYIIPQGTRTATQDSSGVLKSLSENFDFRHCVVTYNTICTDNYIKQFLPQEYKSNYKFIVTKDPAKFPDGIPRQKVISESTYIATDGIIHDEYIVRLYYWQS